MEQTVLLFGKGFNYSQDGPGNRLVYHLAGCNMHCPWCSNPEGMTREKAGRALSVVPTDVMKKEILAARALFYDGGGVTFTGGEATLQYDALRDLLIFCRENGIDTALETNATHCKLPALFPLLSHLMMDCKHWDKNVLREVTGADTQAIFANLEAVAAAGLPALIRIPLIHSFNDREEDPAGFAALFSALRAKVPAGVEGFSAELLPYHEYGRGKWDKLGLPYAVRDGYVTASYCRALTAALQNVGISIRNT